MSRFIFALFFAVALTCSIQASKELDYSYPGNWVIQDTPVNGRSFDVFYIYPTLTADRSKPLMSWHDNLPVAAKATNFAIAQTALFHPDARIFAPYVRQQEYYRSIDFLKGKNSGSGLEFGFLDTVNAFRYYMKHYNQGRPFVLLGHSQGAMDLYELLKRCPEISPDKGFAAAYLIGLPKKTAAQIKADFAGRPIHPASGEKDTGVIIIWNTQNQEAENPLFAVPGGYCINPLNWRTDSEPADKNLNLCSVFYDFRTNSSVTRKNFCGAAVDPSRGVLIVDLPSDSEYDEHGFMGKGVFHTKDIWFFAGNLHQNALTRVRIFTQNQ